MGIAADRISGDTSQSVIFRRLGPHVRLIRFLMIILSFQILIPLLSAQEAKKPNILVYSQGIASDGLDEALEGVNRNVSDVLEQSELNAVIIEEDTERQELLDTAEWLDAYFLVESLYAADQDSFQLEVNAYSTWDGRMIATFTTNGTVDSLRILNWGLALDEIVRTIRTYLQIIEEEDITTDDELEALSDREIEIIAAVPAAGDIPAESPVAADTAEIDDSMTEIPSFSPEAVRIPTLRPIYFEVTVSPLLAVGSASNLFKTGLTSVITGGYTLMLDFGELDLGLMTELTRFHADGVLVSSENWLLSLGPDVGLGIGLGTRFRLFCGVSTGVVMSFIRVSNGDRQTLVGMFASCRLGGRVHFNDRFSLALTSRFTSYLLPSAPVSSVQPSVTAAFRF